MTSLAPFNSVLNLCGQGYSCAHPTMHPKRVVVLVALLALGLPLSLSAQQTATGGSTTAQPSAPPKGNPFSDATQHRADVVNYVLSGQHPTTDALQQLHAVASPTGMQLDTDADFALGAIDIGRRLSVLNKSAEAQVFFQAADDALTAVIGRTADHFASEKVQYLKARANIRAEFLNRLSDARADYDAALKLSPSDSNLLQLRALLPADPAAFLKNHQGIPTKG
jgi:hypothetical protein